MAQWAQEARDRQERQPCQWLGLQGWCPGRRIWAGNIWQVGSDDVVQMGGSRRKPAQDGKVEHLRIRQRRRSHDSYKSSKNNYSKETKQATFPLEWQMGQEYKSWLLAHLY